MAENIFVSKQRLGYYDGKMKAWVTAADEEVLAAAKEHAENLEIYDPAGTAATKVQELADGQVKTNKEAIDKLNGDASTEGSVAKSVADAKSELEEAIAAVEAKADKAQEEVDTVEVDLGDVDGLSTTNKTVVGAINEVLAAVGTGGTAAVVTVTTDITTDGALKSYTIKQGTTTVGVIDIPKDLFVESGEVVTNPEGQAEGTYIKLVLANVAEPLYINVGTLVDIYKAKADATQIQLSIDSSTREISATIVAGSVGTTELADAAVTTVKIADANVTLAKLSTSVQASLAKADAAAPQTALDEEVDRAKAAEAQALTDAKAYTDSEITKEVTARNEAIASAKTEAVTQAGTNADTKDAAILAQAKEYADSKVQGVDLSGIATNAADIDAIEASLAEGGATANAIADAKKAGTDAATAAAEAQADADANTESISELNGRVEALEATTWTEISTDEIDSWFEEA